MLGRWTKLQHCNDALLVKLQGGKAGSLWVTTTSLKSHMLPGPMLRLCLSTASSCPRRANGSGLTSAVTSHSLRPGTSKLCSERHEIGAEMPLTGIFRHDLVSVVTRAAAIAFCMSSFLL